MKSASLKAKWAFAIFTAGMLAACPVIADPPSWAGKGKGKGKEEHREQRDEHKGAHNEHGGWHFEDRQRVVVREYYTEEFHGGGRCPPGLAKKHNGCMPPGQAKKWAIGRPLPRDVVYYEVPEPLVVRIGLPPSGYRYVRVASDILMIAIGTSLVVDAIQDLGRS